MSTSKKEILRQQRQSETLMALGFTQQEAEQLRRISMTLQRWHELECGDGNGYIERDEKTGAPFYVNCNSRYLSPNDPRARRAIPDRETGARKRLAVLIDRRNAREYNPNSPTKIGTGPMDLGAVSAYIQTDPRGAALYIIRPGDVPEGADVSAYYSRGVCVY